MTTPDNAESLRTALATASTARDRARAELSRLRRIHALVVIGATCLLVLMTVALLLNSGTAPPVPCAPTGARTDPATPSASVPTLVAPR